MKRIVWVAGLVAAGLVVGRRSGAQRVVRVAFDRAGSLLRSRCRAQGGSTSGSRAEPRDDVDDSVVADRVRSSLGLLEHRLDVPRVHVTVERRVAVLHGEVGRAQDVTELVDAARAVPGVRDVRSHLHVGLGAGDSRPSEADDRPSPGMRSLLQAARGHGGGEETASSAAAAVLETFAGMLIAGELEHVASHLSPDVRRLLVPAPGARPGQIRHVDELHAAVASTGALPPDRVPLLVDAVLTALRDLVPDEAADVRALLPTEIRALWDRGDPLYAG
jgi:uncharacterized protein (DUF2267 family)